MQASREENRTALLPITQFAVILCCKKLWFGFALSRQTIRCNQDLSYDLWHMVCLESAKPQAGVQTAHQAKPWISSVANDLERAKCPQSPLWESGYFLICAKCYVQIRLVCLQRQLYTEFYFPVSSSTKCISKAQLSASPKFSHSRRIYDTNTVRQKLMTQQCIFSKGNE